MKTKHAKSPCCGARAVRFGQRRRQCTKCRKTWRIRKKKRGRKHLRPNIALALKYLRHEIVPMHARARVQRRAADALERRVQASRDYFLAHSPWPIVPSNAPLIALADAMMRTVSGTLYTAYFVLLRPIDGTEATICKPLLLEGKENPKGWHRMFNCLSGDVMSRIEALVCDGHVGLVSVAIRHGWLLQWCNFHIIAAIQGRRSRFSASRHQGLGKHLYNLVCQILRERDKERLRGLVTAIESIGWETSSKQLRRIIAGFLTHIDRYRTYLDRPELKLPRTNNSCETLIGEFQKLAQRMRGWNNIKSLKNWFAAYIKNKKTIKCNPSDQPH